MIFVCPKCKGKGRVWDHGYGIFTFGFGYLFDVKDKCDKCDGKGFVSVKEN